MPTNIVETEASIDYVSNYVKNLNRGRGQWGRQALTTHPNVDC